MSFQQLSCVVRIPNRDIKRAAFAALLDCMERATGRPRIQRTNAHWLRRPSGRLARSLQMLRICFTLAPFRVRAPLPLQEPTKKEPLSRLFWIAWSGQRDSNPRMSAWEADALPLGDARMGFNSTTAIGAAARSPSLRVSCVGIEEIQRGPFFPHAASHRGPTCLPMTWAAGC